MVSLVISIVELWTIPNLMEPGPQQDPLLLKQPALRYHFVVVESVLFV